MKRILEWLNVLFFLLLVFGFAIAFWLLPDRAFSEQENRSLQSLPHWDSKSFFAGSLSNRINSYYADQFPLRDSLVGVKASCELLLGKGENGGIILGKNNQLARRLFDIRLADGRVIADMDYYDEAAVLAAVDGINQAASNSGQPFSVLLTGRTIDIAASSFQYPCAISDALIKTIDQGLLPQVDAIETVELLRNRYDAGEVVYFRTDHHWTARGAYYAYAEAMRHFGMEHEILPERAFVKRTVSDSFYGTAWSASGIKQVEPDSLELWLYGNEADFEVIADGTPLEGMYCMHHLERKDHYSVFLDGTHDVVTVRLRGEAPRPTLLILKDSFANAIAPFLAQHFDLVLLNLSSTRTDFTNVTAYAEQYDADRILLVYTVENVMTADKLKDLQ